MKSSRFNIRTTLDDGRLLLFNYWTLALVAIEPGAAAKAAKILGNPGRQANARGHRRLAGLLQTNGFLVPDGEDELSALHAAFRAQRVRPDVLSLTIVPTLACNFDCPYCCEGRTHRGRMTRAVEDALLPFAARRLALGGTLEVSWYGGEPLLATSTIERLARAFRALCDERSARYESAIVTNGYLLDASTARWLKQLHVTSAQVTLDGPHDVHDRRRPLASGGATFARIVENLKSAVDILNISLRTNIDKDNRSSVAPLLDALLAAGIGHKVYHYTAPVTSVSAGCSDGSGRCLASSAFSLVTLEASLDLTRRGLQDGSRPRSTDGPCGATRGNSFVVNPDGGLAACWDEAGRPDRYIGHLLEPHTDRMERNRQSWLEYDPFVLDCRECEVLPVCMSRCPYQVRETGTLPCPGWKHHPDEHLLNEYRLRKLDRERQVAAGLLDLRNSLREAARQTGSARRQADEAAHGLPRP